eukprot:1367395-Heterocapsa_arctica.AAC.1
MLDLKAAAALAQAAVIEAEKTNEEIKVELQGIEVEIHSMQLRLLAESSQEPHLGTSPTAWLSTLPKEVIEDPRWAAECAEVHKAEGAFSRLCQTVAKAKAEQAAKEALAATKKEADATPVDPAG